MSDSEDDDLSDSVCGCGFCSDNDENTGDGIDNNATEEDTEEKVRSVSYLVDLAAKVAGKHCSCVVLESQKNPPLDERMLKKVAFWAFPQDEKQVKVISSLNEKTDTKWEDGEKLFNSSKIEKDVRQIGFMVNGILKEKMASGGEHEIAAVTLSFEMQRITSTTCTACHDSLWCGHISAVVIYRIRHAAKVPVHAPLTEVLSDLPRHQLQMVVQYAIRENAGAILGRIFKHIDAAFDPQSDMNKELAAPDPTFGLSSEETQITELSLEQIGRDLTESLLKMRYCPGNYPDTGDFVRKTDSDFCKQYFKKVVDLVNNNEPELSGKILIKMAKSSLDELSNHHAMYRSIKRVFHDTERLFSCFILSNTGPIREEMIRAANDINGIARNTAPNRFLKVSDWADISCLKLDSCVLNKDSDENEPEANILGASPSAPFYQPLCASLVLDAPQSLADVLSGNSANTLTTSYDEPLPVMMLRFDWLMHTGCLESNKKLYKLGIVILRRLIYLSDQFSITGSSFPLHYTENSETDSMQTLFDDQDVDFGPSEPKKARLCSTFDFYVNELDRDDISAVLDIIDAEMVDQEPPDLRRKELKTLTKSQVSYSLLHVCYYMYHIKDMISVGDFELPVVMNAALRAIEIGRFRSFAPKDSISADEYKWLLDMEEKIQESYLNLFQSGSESVKTYQMQVFQTYLSALRKKGLNFYGNHLAVKLLVLLVKTGQMDQDASVQLCVDAICFSVSPLQGLSIPESYATNNLAEMKRLWTILMETLFQPYLKEDNTETYSDSITKVLQHLGMVEDCSFCLVAYQVFKNNNLPTKLTMKHKDLFLRFLIHSIKQSNLTDFKEFGVHAMCNTIKEIGPELETAFPELIFPAWNDIVKFFYEFQLKEIAQVLTESIQKCGGNPPRKTFDMMFKYFEANFVHGSESCELLKCLTTEFLRHEALKRINSNHSNYTPSALFLIAKMEHENNLTQRGSQDCLQFGNIFRKNVFMLILFAFYRIKQMKNDQGFRNCDYETITDHLKWCFDQIAGSGNEQVRSGSQYDVFIENFMHTFDERVEILVSFLKDMEKCEPLLKKAKKKFNTKLVDCYRTQFFDCMQNCRQAAYKRILKSMSDARGECVKYVENGSHLFKTQITDPIRRIHKGKRKFLFLMNQYHQDLLREDDEASESEEI